MGQKEHNIKDDIATIGDTRNIENLDAFIGLEGKQAFWRIVHEAELMDKELDIVHSLLTELYDYDNVLPKIKKALNKIKRLRYAKEN